MTSSAISCRYSEPGHLFDDKGSSCFISDKEYDYVLALINSCVGNYFLNLLNPTISFQSGNIGTLPLNELYFGDYQIKIKVDKNVYLAKEDWDSFETSWDFKRNPLV